MMRNETNSAACYIVAEAATADHSERYMQSSTNKLDSVKGLETGSAAATDGGRTSQMKECLSCLRD